MNEETLVRAILDRAANPATRTDYVNRRPVEIGTVAMPTVIQAGQRAMGCCLYPLHRRLFEEIGNGGFGPGDGLIGLPGGALDVNGRSIVELKSILWLDRDTPLPPAIIPLCDWGNGMWSCIDSNTGAILTLSEFGFKEMGQNFHSWLEDWVHGTDIWQRMVILENRTMVDPFTKQARVIKVVAGVVGRQYMTRSQRN
jgi:hypothetical protein